MKHGKRPTVAQCNRIIALGLDADSWLVVKDTPEVFVIVHRESGVQKTFQKE